MIILEKSSSEAQQTNSFGVIIYRDRYKSLILLEQGTSKYLWWKSNFKQICFEILWKMPIVSQKI